MLQKIRLKRDPPVNKRDIFDFAGNINSYACSITVHINNFVSSLSS